MVKNYRNINDDIRVVLSLAREKLAVDSHDIAKYRDPRIIISRIEQNKGCIERLAKAIKS